MKLFFAKNIAALFVCSLVSATVIAQPNTTIDLEKKKPEKYKEKLLKSEHTGEKKYGALKHFFGNTVTHYNYFYNANVKLDEILEKAKETFVDDYSKFLPFYNYSLTNTAQDNNVDSVIFKCNAGILLHDLRSDWVDDMYMLLGKAYLYRKDFDSAHYVFQYLNYIYAPKDDGYDIPIGSNASGNDGVFSVSTNEKKRPFIQKLLLRKPLERNTTFIWLTRNYLEQRKTGEAASLISILRQDPIFPKRLQTDLNEMSAYCYYLMQQYDSSAYYLEKSLSNAQNKIEKSRWEFLCGQMYQRAGLYADANRVFEKAISHSANPLLDVYAHLNMIGQYAGINLKDKKNKTPIGNVEALVKLAKKERYANYRDIIYYAAGKISMLQNDAKGAVDFYYKSATLSIENPTQKSNSYLALADLKYDFKEYKQAYSFYDSVNIKLIDSNDIARVVARKPALKIISKNIDAIHLQDSLQTLAKLSAKDLNLALKKIYKQYKKAKGLKEEANSFDFGSDNAITTPTIPSFTSIDAKPGEFYFSNDAVKSQGSKDFKSKWGNRPNVDNWNRAAAFAGKFDTEKKAKEEKSDAEKALGDKKNKSKNVGSIKLQGDDISDAMALGNPDDDRPLQRGKDIGIGESLATEEEVEITPESLYNTIPLSADKIEASNNIIINSLFENGETFSDKLEDYPSAIATYEELLRRFPKNIHTEQALFNLSYCYKRVNKNDKVLATQEKLELDFSKGNLSSRIKNKNADPEKDVATQKYAAVYDMFLEGKYAEAKIAKSQADSIFKQKYWNPQLSFIEAVHYIKQREDSTAIEKLTLMVKGNTEKALQEKAALMIEILKNRKQIEKHLANLDSNGVYDSALAKLNDAKQDSIAIALLLKEKQRQNVLQIDSSLIGKPFFNNPNEPHLVVLLLDKVDDVFIAETIKSFTQYNKDKLGNNTLIVKSLKLNQQYNLILIGPFSNAPNGISFMDDVKPQTSKILPWLPVFKYTYSLIGISNLEILKANNNMDKYKVFLKNTYPTKF